MLAILVHGKQSAHVGITFGCIPIDSKVVDGPGRGGTCQIVARLGILFGGAGIAER